MTAINLLPPEEKKRIRRIYRFRLGIVILSLTFVLLSIISTFLLPSLFLIGVKEERLMEGLSARKDETTPGMNKDVEALVQETKRQMDIFFEGDGREASEAIRTVLAKSGDSVTLLGFFFQKVYKEGTDEDKLVLRGEALTRNSLISFADRLKASALFESVNLPVSDLAQSSGITFSITAVLKQSKKEP